ncbi:hypothetical protein [Muribaculum intestinale]|uniref:hypothetical protein n=1 Tax=Muribaculum intestinale TaxID=1796646 RepID=UPI000F497F46|nr:hypothetical protein [Muribaculum intestinale]ROT11178.1 hypothetical protein EEL42_00235 [Muribaculaceae bacterium Isolate-100 (HZI)]RXE67188.1 hypothetical protein ED388_00230 [Muribaculaceae bacterium Isolate-007 (NCI)]
MKFFALFPLLSFMLLACTTTDEPIYNNDVMDRQEIQQKYDVFKALTIDNLNNSLSIILNSNSRSPSTINNGNEYIDILTNLPVETVDSLYHIYCTPSAEILYNDNFDIILQALTDNSSIEEVQALYNFTDEYIANGGHDMELLYHESQQVSPIIGECMISCAAAIDEFILDESDYRIATSHCIRDLCIKLIEMGIDNAVSEVVDGLLSTFPGVDVAYELFTAGCDLYSAIKLAYEYNQCCLTSIS